MPRFMYNVRDGRGQLASGVVAAPTLEEAGRVLRSEGKFIVKLDAVADEAADDRPLSLAQHARRCSREDVIFFAHQLAVMVDTGVPITEALQCITEQAANPHFRGVVEEITRHVQGGGELSVALKKFPGVFPTIMTSLVKASEVSGTMGAMLDRVSTYMAKEQRTIKQARGALVYPAFMLCTAAGVTVFLMAFVLPRFAGIYASRQAALPWPTRLLMFLSQMLVDWWFLWVGLAVVLGVGGYLVGRSPSGRRGLDWLKLHTPIARTLFTHLYVTRACRTLGTMIASGVSMLDSVAIIRQVTNNVFFQELWDQVDDDLRKGLQLSDPLMRSALIPRSVAQMVRSGEKSGRLGQVMTRVADHTEAEFDEIVKRTTQFIEPVMVIVMGSVVGFIAISLLLPIFSVSTVVAGK